MCMTRIEVVANFMHGLDMTEGVHSENEGGEKVGE